MREQVGTPLGADTLFLLATKQRLSDPDVLIADGVLDEGRRGAESGFDELVTSMSNAGTRGPRSSPTNWLVQQVVLPQPAVNWKRRSGCEMRCVLFHTARFAMRREARATALLLLGAAGAGVFAAAQKPPQQNVTVILLNTHEQPPQPVKAVRVSLNYLDSSVMVTDAQQVTNSQGQALLVVSSGVAQRGDLRIEITGAADLVIYQPADGQINALPATVKVSLLPKGSPALLGPAQIEAMLHRTLLQVNSLQRENRALKSQAAQAESQKPDLSAALAAWAQANGFSSAQVDEQVEQWAQNIQQQAAQATAEQKALAEVALKHYASAAQLFNQAADSDAGQLDAEEQAFLNARRDKLRQLIGDREQAASAFQLNLQYHQATQTLESAVATAAAEYKKHPDDKGFHELWLRALLSAADARSKEGVVSPASDSLRLLAQSADDEQMLAREYAALGDRQGGAAAQDRLGIALMREGERAGGEKSAALLEQAVEAFRNALEVYTKADLPRDWARTQNNLGISLQDEGERAGGDKAIALLDKAVRGLPERTRGLHQS